MTTTTGTSTTIATDDDVDNTGQDDDAADDDDDTGDNVSSTTSEKGDNRNRNNGKDAYASTAMTPAHRRQRRHWQRVLSRGRGQGNTIIPSVNNISSYDPWLAIFWSERK